MSRSAEILTQAPQNIHLALDVRLWKPKPYEPVAIARERAVQDFASALIEMKVGASEERINPVELLLDGGQLVDPATNVSLRDVLRNETELDKLENEGFRRIELFIQDHDSAVWISPPGHGYDEARLMLFVKDKEDPGRITTKALALEISDEECLQAANNILKDLKVDFYFTQADQLRALPIPFQLGEDDLIDLLEQHFVFAEVWEAVKRGDDMTAKEAALGIAKQVIDKYFEELLGVESLEEGIIIGAKIEKAAEAWGHRIQQTGSCGNSNQKLAVMVGAFSLLASGNLSMFLSVSKGEFFNCPTCNGPIPSGYGIVECPFCHALKSEQPVVCD